MVRSWFGRIGFGPVVIRWTVWSSIFLTSLMLPIWSLKSEFFDCARLMLKITSSASNVSPS